MQNFVYYNFEDFLNVVKHLDSEDILLAARQKLVQLEKTSVRAKKEGVGELIQNINDLVAWIKTGKKPTRLAPHEFIKLKPICENLVAKRQMNSTTIKQFNFQ